MANSAGPNGPDEIPEIELPVRLRVALSDYTQRVRAGLGSHLHGLQLFGSWARGQARADSDVDVWVLVDEIDAETRRLAFDAAQATLLERGVDLSVTLMDEREWQHLRGRERRLALDIEREGIPL
jgi:predicted nucleotidyltransferase